MDQLKPKQQRFVAEYVLDQNAAEAYKRAGYRAIGRSAEVCAHRLLRKAAVRAAIDAILRQRNEEIKKALEAGAAAQERLEAEAGAVHPAVKEAAIKINAEMLMKEAGAIAFSDIGDIFDFSGPVLKLKPMSEVPAHARRAIAVYKTRRYVEGRGEDAREVEVIEIKFWDKLAALNALMKVFGLGQEPAALRDILEMLATVNDEVATALKKGLIERHMANRKGVPKPSDN
jgi:phage terminase small subunit